MEMDMHLEMNPQTDTTTAHEQSRQGAPPGAPTVDLNITEITEQDSTGEPEPPPSTRTVHQHHIPPRQVYTMMVDKFQNISSIFMHHQH